MTEPKPDTVCIKRPYADNQRINEVKPLCGGDRFQTHVIVAEDGDLSPLFPSETYCEGCLSIHRGDGAENRHEQDEQPARSQTDSPR